MVPSEAQSPNESCAEKDRLQRSYSFAIADMCRAVQVLDRYKRTMDRLEYERLCTFAEEMLRLSERARRCLEQHKAKHDC